MKKKREKTEKKVEGIGMISVVNFHTGCQPDEVPLSSSSPCVS